MSATAATCAADEHNFLKAGGFCFLGHFSHLLLFCFYFYFFIMDV